MTHPDLQSADLTSRVAELVDHPADEELVARVVWSCLVEPGDGVAGRLVATLGAAAALHEVWAGSQLAPAAAGIPPREWAKAIERWTPRMAPGTVRSSVETASAAGARLLTPADPRWPQTLDDLGDHVPLCLWVRGDPAALTRSAVSIALVGARAATGYGEHIAGEFGADLAARGAAVVSGAAYGIDGAAHRGALATGGTTVAMLAGGADRPYPTGNARLIAQIAETGGAVVSEVPCGAAPTRWRFLQRNRIIAALAGATVVVEAGWRSGSLNTAGHAADLGRPLGAVPGPVTSAASAGCHRLLREYDARCVTNADDVMELVGATGAVPTSIAAGEPRTDDRTRVLDALSMRTRRSAGDVARRAGMSLPDVHALLGLLELAGEVAGVDGQWRRAESVPVSASATG